MINVKMFLAWSFEGGPVVSRYRHRDILNYHTRVDFTRKNEMIYKKDGGTIVVHLMLPGQQSKMIYSNLTIHSKVTSYLGTVDINILLT